MGFRVSNRYFCLWKDWNSLKIPLCGEIPRWREVKQFLCNVFFLNTQSWRTLASFGHYCVPMHTNLFNILCFSCQGKSRDIVYQRIWLFLWVIFAQHGLFEFQLTIYSALSRLTDLENYITRCGLWLLTIFHIPYTHFQRKLRKVTSPKLNLSFLFSIYPPNGAILYWWMNSGNVRSMQLLKEWLWLRKFCKSSILATLSFSSVSHIPYYVNFRFNNGPNMSSVLACFLRQFGRYT